jgi:hypothetical protein
MAAGLLPLSEEGYFTDSSVCSAQIVEHYQLGEIQPFRELQRFQKMDFQISASAHSWICFTEKSVGFFPQSRIACLIAFLASYLALAIFSKALRLSASSAFLAALAARLASFWRSR